MQHVEASAPEVLTSRLVRTKSNADSVSLAVPGPCDERRTDIPLHVKHTSSGVTHSACVDDKAQVPTHICRLLTFLPGKMFALASPHSDEVCLFGPMQWVCCVLYVLYAVCCVVCICVCAQASLLCYNL